MQTKSLSIIGSIIVLLVILGAVLYAENPQKTTPPGDQSKPTEGPQQPIMVNVYSPAPNAQVTSPLTVYGEARGSWYFEGSFPVKLYDANSNLLAAAPAQAMSDWMTTDFVSFSVTLTFPTPTTATGTLVLEKDNPSGLPQNADSVSIPVSF